MNYIPGFSNYLETSVPRYANGGAIMDDPRKAAVMPMTQEAAPNYFSGLNLSDADLAALSSLNSANEIGGVFNQGNYGSDFGALDNVYGMNFGTDFGGGLQGGSLYKVNPYMQTFQAPLDNQGKPTAYNNNTLEVKSPTQVFRLLDQNTGQVVYEGVGYEGAQEAMKRASALSAEGGTKAKWDIQTPNSQQKSGYSTVATETRQQSTLGDIASFALPVAMAVLTGGMSLPAQMAGAAIAGAAGAGLAGKNPAKAGLLSAATAGIMGGSGANDAIGRAVGSVGSALASKTAEGLAKKAAEKTAEQIIVTGLSKAAQGAGSAIGNTLLSQGVKSGLSSVTGYKTPAEQFAQQPSPIADPTAIIPYDGINVIGPNLVSGSGSPFGAAFSIPVNEMLSGTLNAAQPTSTEQPKTAEDIEAAKNPIVVTGGGTTTGLGALPALAGGITSTLPALTELAMDPTLVQPATEDIVVNGNKAIPKTVVPDVLEAVGPILPQLGIPQVPTPDPALTKKPLGVEDYLSLGGKAVGLLGNLVGGGSQGQTGTYTRGGGSLNPIFSAKLPSAGGLGTIGANRTVRPMGDVDWLTYGTRPELNFYDYAARPSPAPVTTPVPGNPAGPIMQQRDPMAMAKGGRTEFAVNGPGTGRSDDIPAVLSDGEYVIDAETVALLGDGSSKAGAKKLDDLRVKVRKHKGQKLAKGRFSANAKKPEAYLSGGRI